MRPLYAGEMGTTYFMCCADVQSTALKIGAFAMVMLSQECALGGC